jgi:hypothetical protein
MQKVVLTENYAMHDKNNNTRINTRNSRGRCLKHLIFVGEKT